MCDINGVICEGDEGLNPGQEEISHISNLAHEHGKLADAMKGPTYSSAYPAPVW